MTNKQMWRTNDVPESIQVFGAGIDAVNGTYKKNVGYGPVKYKKLSRLFDGTIQYELCITQGDVKRWEIKSADAIYTSDDVSSSSSLPPSRGWWPMIMANVPPPILFSDYEAILDWRHPAEESLSDYTIEIVTIEKRVKAVKKYHCHKVVLASTSKYFHGLLCLMDKDGPTFAEGQVNISRIELDATTAKYMPMILDYMYSSYSQGGAPIGSMVRPARPNRIADSAYMYWLADYFQISRLVKNIQKFWSTALRARDCARLVNAALSRHIQPALDAVFELFRCRLSSFDTSSMDTLIDACDLAFALKLLQETGNGPGHSLILSKAIAACCRNHAIDTKLFKSLIDKAKLPSIDKSAVLTLLEKERELCGDLCPATVSNLQKRCIEALALDFGHLQLDDKSSLQLQSGAFLCNLLNKSRLPNNRSDVSRPATLTTMGFLFPFRNFSRFQVARRTALPPLKHWKTKEYTTMIGRRRNPSFPMLRPIALFIIACHFLIARTAAEATPNSPTLRSHNTNGESNLFQQKGQIDDSQNGSFLSTSQTQPSNDIVTIRKRDGRTEIFNPDRVYKRLETLATSIYPPLNIKYLNLTLLTESIARGVYPDLTTTELDGLIAESASSLSTQHPDYGRLAARVLVSQSHKQTPQRFSQAIEQLYQNGRGFISEKLAGVVLNHADWIDAQIVDDRDYEMTYFGFKTLERAYLLRDDKGRILERPQYMWMRVALGIHCCGSNLQEGRNDDCLKSAMETYNLMSQGYFTHASPTLFHAGTTHPQLSSCFLVQMSDDSIHGIYDTLHTCAVISKAAGGIGLSVHNIRARGTLIKGTRGVSNGLVPMLRVYDVTSRYVDQGGGKRPGAFAVYIEPWHADIFDVLNLKKNHGKEEQRARDLFYGLWIPDLFMRRVQEGGMWSLMCPHECPGLQDRYGHNFRELYEKYEQEGRFVRQVRARDLWGAILESQIETGTPYMLYKDACNAKSNQQNIGTIQCSNLCTEIIQYTDKDEVSVCNLASICLPKFVVSDRGPVGSINPASGRAYFDHAALHDVAKVVTRNLNKIIDINSYPVEGAKLSNMRHRPIGIGVSGLADAFLRLGLPFTSPEARQLNEAIFETIYHAALEASAEIAVRDGPYASFADSPASRGLLQHHLWGASDDETPSHQYSAAGDKLHKNQRYPESAASGGYDWQGLAQQIKSTGLRNSLLVAPMPTASTSQILGVNECFEPFSSNLYVRRVKAGEFIMANPHLLQDLTDRGLWTASVRNQLMRHGGSIRNIPEIPDRLKELYKTVWEIKMKDIIDMAADRGKFVDQSQSLNLFIADPTVDKLTSMHFYAWKKGLKTGMYYLRTKPAVNAIQYTVESESNIIEPGMLPEANDDVCLSCSA
ncbi:hypothetical protein MPSEU_000419700 [Mayamaea pseudoterrestris]|nr:hypothetical protein MPSEU_000419700 [Mayamaea pseudoterrestris]